MSKIILLNGASSSGKTSTAKSIQYLSDEPWLTFGIDTFIQMTPYPSPGKEAEYFSFIPGENVRGKFMKIELKDSGQKLFGIMPDFAALLAGNGNNLIIDEVLLDDVHIKSYIKKLSQYTVYFIGVICELPIMQEREFLRRDRELGLSNDQFDRVHSENIEYDFTVDTSNSSVFEISSRIINFVKNNKKPKAFINFK
jgi:chloramphenicol 3-O phosphotransferase